MEGAGCSRYSHTIADIMGKLLETADKINHSRYREWCLRNYGESGKTKTVTKRKYERIMKVLRGKERFAGPASSENGKFRFWVRGKGFKLGRPLGYPVVGTGDEVLLVPVKSTTADNNIIDKGYKQVAVVEDFCDIIYNVHVQTEGKEGKHAGQKRTYRAVSEKFAFLPREAVTRFLMSCKDCKTRMQLTFESSDKKKSVERTVTTVTETRETAEAETLDMRYGLPITTTYYSHLRNLQYMSENEDLLSEASIDTDMTEPSILSETRSMGSVDAATIPAFEAPLDLKKGDGRASASPIARSPGKERATPSPPKVQKGSNGIGFPGMDVSKDAPEDLSVSKDDDDDDDGDDDSEKANEPTPAGVDPERLKSFNMFVRLFVDENLDRIVPISKQPKEKIQAIIEACYRQFPEFHERARKRIRTYLKSCRRMKRQRDQNGIDSSTIRPTPPHLTSARAEQILAAACESESENARRMRMELLQQQQQLQQHTPQPTVTVQSEPQPDRTTMPNQATPPTRPVDEAIPKPSPRTTAVAYPHFENGVSGSHDPFYVTTQHQTPIQPAIQHTPMTNGPTDLSVKKLSSSKAQLSPTEIANIRQLITSYRESAAFLYRSADELEQMLLQLN